MNGVMGVVTCFAGGFAPKNWLTCDGQLLPIANNKALFSILSNTYGGDGISTFALPDLRGRTPVSPGVGVGQNYKLGQPVGSETVTITGAMLPAHTHTGVVNVALPASSADGIDTEVQGAYPSRYTGAYNPTPDCVMGIPQTFYEVVPSVSQPANICSPYMAIYYVICVNGIFPSRN